MDIQQKSRIIEEGDGTGIDVIHLRCWNAMGNSRSGMIVGDFLLASVKIDALSDTELLNLSRGGDNVAFGALWERHRLAGIVAARNIAPSLDPDDLVSGAYLKIFELVRDGRGPSGAFRPYLYKVISTIAADTYRSPEHSSSDLTEVPDLTEAGPWEDGAFDLNAAARAFESLPERWQAVLWYSEVEGLAPRQIAPILGMSANGVSALSARAKEGLQSAWVETHIDMQLADQECATTRSHLQRYQLGKLTSRRSREVVAHLDTCESCASAAAEFRTLNKQLALVLAMILLGGAPAAALLKSLGATTVSAGAGTGAAAAVSPGAAGSSSSASGNSAAGSTAGATAAGTGAGIGVGVIALVTTATLAVAAIGGIVIANTIGSNSASAPTDEISQVESEPESTNSPGADKTRTEDLTSLSLTDSKDTAESTLTSRASAPSRETEEKPSTPPPSRPTPPPTLLPPPIVPPVAPAEIIAGYQCFVPHLDTGEFELRGRASLPATVQVVFRSNAGVATLDYNVAADRYWSTGPVVGPLSDLDDFLDGTITAEVRLIDGTNSSLWENVTVTQCAGTGPTLDTSLKVSNVCVLDPGTITVIGDLTEYGVIFARHRLNGTVTQISDPALEGVEDPLDSSVNWSGIFTGSDPAPASPPDWFSQLSLAPYLGTVADYNGGASGAFDVRAQTPDGRTSTWMHINQLIDLQVCPIFP